MWMYAYQVQRAQLFASLTIYNFSCDSKFVLEIFFLTRNILIRILI